LLDLDALRRGGISIEDAEGILSLDGLPRSVLEIASSLRDESLGREIRFLIPQPRFPSVSVTGARCALRCEHCKGHFLTGMANTNTPEKLKDFCSRLYAEGGVGVLVSGGSDPKGHVPLEEFLDAITWVKENTSLIVNLHTGLLNPGQAEDIASTGADVVSMDVVGSDDTIKGVYGLDATVKDYAESLVNLRDARVPYLVPHVCAGLDFGEIKGEARALEIIGDVDPDIIVIIALIPTRGTGMENVKPPSVETIAKTVAAARLMHSDTSVAIGCMRPKAEKNLEELLAIQAGADRIVLPSRSTVEYALSEGFMVKHLDGCCAIPKGLEHLALRVEP
jgi:uncharacterized radical SAM superfamily protein